MNKSFKTITTISAVIAVFLLNLSLPSTAFAYSCKAVFSEAQALLKEADGLVTKNTDSRIRAMIAEARGLSKAGLVSHSKANEKHVGATGKYAHGDSVRKGRWAVSLAKEALFLLDGKTR